MYEKEILSIILTEISQHKSNAQIQKVRLLTKSRSLE